MERLEGQHRAVQPRLVAGHPAGEATSPGGLTLVEDDRPRADVRVALQVVRVRVGGVVLVHPPAVAEPVQEVAREHAQQPARWFPAGDLTVRGVVTVESGLRGYHREDRS